MYVTTTLQGPNHDDSHRRQKLLTGWRETRKTMTADDGEMRRKKKKKTTGQRGGDEEGDKDDGMTRTTGERQRDRGQRPQHPLSAL
jgi:hypothetical protein